jgi:hypothetical protein
MQFTRSGTFALAVTITGGVLLGVSFAFAYQLYNVYLGIASGTTGQSAQFIGSLNALLAALIPVMVLAVMGWIGSIFLLRGVDFMKVDRGVGLVTFKVDKSVGVVGDQSGQVGMVTGVQAVSKNSEKASSQDLDLSKASE